MWKPINPPQTIQNTITGQIIESTPKYFVLKNEKLKVLVWSDKQPLVKQNVSVKGIGQKWQVKNFMAFDQPLYYSTKGIDYQIRKGKITTKNYTYKNKIKPSYIQSWFNLVFLNKKDDISSNFYNYFQKLGLAHLVVISSFHIGFLFSMINRVFNKVIGLIGVFCFCWYISFTIPSQKALIFLTLYTLFSNKFSKLDILSITGLIFIAINPMAVASASFLLTILFSYLILLNNIKSKFRKIIGIKTVGIYVSWIFSGTINLLNFASIFFSPIIFIIYIAIIFKLEFVLKWIEIFIANLSSYQILFVPGFNSYVSFILLILLVIWLSQFWSYHKYSYKTLILMVGVFWGLKFYNNQTSYITYINVGQADSALIKVGKKAFLIDVGREGAVSKVIAPYLYKEGVSKVDKIYISHDHNDHSGGLKDNHPIMKNAKVLFTFHKDQWFENLNHFNFKDINNASMVLLFKYNNRKFLFTGDIESDGEKAIFKDFEKINVLKIAHHGSKTSTTQFFLDQTNPDTAIISTGPNGYGHPHPTVLKRLQDNEVKIYNTYRDGAVKVYLNNNKELTSDML